MNPVLRLRPASRRTAANQDPPQAEAEEIADQAADAVSDYAYSRQESDLRFERTLTEFRREMAEFRTQVAVAILAAAVTIIVTLID